MFRFYAKRIGDEYHVLNSRNLNQHIYSESEVFGCNAKFCEIVVSMGYIHHVLEVNPLDVDEVKPAALKAAEDHNMSVLVPKPKHVDRKNSQELRATFQEYIDRTHVYGTSFEKEFQQLLSKYPLKVAVKDNFYRAVVN